jgi:hypothetical protein
MKMALHVYVILAYRGFARTSLNRQPHLWGMMNRLRALFATCRQSR